MFMTKYILTIVLTISTICVSVLASESYPLPTVMYPAQPGDFSQVAETNGRTPKGRFENISIAQRHNDLRERASFQFPGSDAVIVIDDAPLLNPTKQLTLSVWFKLAGNIPCDFRLPLLFKSRPAPQNPESDKLWYYCQYGLMLIQSEAGPVVTLGLSSGGKQVWIDSPSPLKLLEGWNQLTVTFDGRIMVVYMNGNKYDQTEVSVTATIDQYPTPLFVGACGNPPQAPEQSFSGEIGEFVLWDNVLSAENITAFYGERQVHYPKIWRNPAGETDYSRAVNAALAASEDVWANEVLATGDPSFDKVKDYLRPLFFSIGKTYKDHAPYNVVLSLEDGARPLIAAAGDGSGVYVDKYANDNSIVFYVGVDGKECYGSVLDRLDEQHWEEGWLPVFHTSYTTDSGVRWRQELAALKPPKEDGILVALGRFEPTNVSGDEVLRITLPPNSENRFRASAGKRDGNIWVWSPSESSVFYYAFALGEALPSDLTVDSDSYQKAKNNWCEYWRGRIEDDGILFSVPEKLVMNCQRNKLYQNLVLRWRYSVGCAIYNNEFYQPESSDTMMVMTQYGYPAEARDGLAKLLQWEKPGEMYNNWEKAEKLAHAVEYWHYTHDDTFIRERADSYRELMLNFQRQMAGDPNGLLEKQRHCGDIPNKGYYCAHLTTAWRGMRDMANLFGWLGYEQDAVQFSASAKNLHTNLSKAMRVSERRLPDGTLFIPRGVYSPETTIYAPICATRLGSYWNLVIPYAFASGFWQETGEDMDAILGFLRKHGAFLMGMIRFNYYPTEIGAYTPDGIAGYYTYGVDNVYLPSIMRVLSARDETDAILLTFYSYLAHGMTRGTFISGEGDSIGIFPFPNHNYRSMYGSFTNAQNAAFLQALRALLIQETFDAQGNPDVLRLTPATPKVWLEEGNTISFKNTPTIFGTMSGNIFVSPMGNGTVIAEWTLPSRNPPNAIHWRLRLPGEKKIVSVKVDGKVYNCFDSAAGIVDLTGIKGTVSVEVLCQ
jgi:hypothetical protein